MLTSLNPLKSLVLSSYKNLLRAQKNLFKNDFYQLNNAKRYTKEQFLKNKLKTSNSEIQELVDIAKTAEITIKTQIVQGVKKTDSPDETFALNITENTALGDNESIKINGEKNKNKKKLKQVSCK
ncbi:hypothetical protein HDU92_004398 [Lobulomyces angularis]|nr:hypothetical protein HDU92_004398 [Lobulomyces angularis]